MHRDVSITFFKQQIKFSIGIKTHNTKHKGSRGCGGRRSGIHVPWQGSLGFRKKEKDKRKKKKKGEDGMHW